MNNIKIIFLSITVLFLTACSKESSIEDLKRKIGEKRSETIGEVEPVPEFETYIPYVYRNSNLKSPFQESVVKIDTKKIVTTKIKPDLNRKKEHLESFNIDNFKMLGIINKDGEAIKAIVSVDSKIYRVSKGNYIGKNNGKIVNINKDKIEIKEIVQNGSYRWIERPAEIVMLRGDNK